MEDKMDLKNPDLHRAVTRVGRINDGHGRDYTIEEIDEAANILRDHVEEVRILISRLRRERQAILDDELAVLRAQVAAKAAAKA
jgi:hypothetical protein